MTTAATRIREIEELEGFSIRVFENGQLIDPAKQGLPSYRREFERSAKGSMTVSEWKQTRFKKVYPNLDVDVLFDDGSAAHGNTTLTTVRESYEGD